MGQKINSKLFRLGVNRNEWDSYYIEKNWEESTLLIYTDKKIREYISRLLFMKGLLLHTCKIRYSVEALRVSIYYYSMSFKSGEISQMEQSLLIELTQSLYLFLNKNDQNTLNIEVRLCNLNSRVIEMRALRFDYVKKVFRKFSKDQLFQDILDVVMVSLLVKNSSRLLVNFLVVKLKNIKTQTKVLFYLKMLLLELVPKEIIKVIGLKLLIKGRFNKAQRARKKDIIVGSVPLQTIKSNIDYFQSTAFTVVGTFGIKLWICRQM